MIVNAAATVYHGIGIDDFTIPARFRHADTVTIPRHRREIADDYHKLPVAIAPHETENRLIRIVMDDPFETGRVIIESG